MSNDVVKIADKCRAAWVAYVECDKRPSQYGEAQRLYNEFFDLSERCKRAGINPFLGFNSHRLPIMWKSYEQDSAED